MSWNSMEKLERDVEQAMRNSKIYVMQQVVEQREGLVSGSIDLAVRNGGVREIESVAIGISEKNSKVTFKSYRIKCSISHNK